MTHPTEDVNPTVPTADELYATHWYTVVEDTTGGWAISTVNKPVSAHDHRIGDRVLAEFVFEEHAREVVKIHNIWLGLPHFHYAPDSKRHDGPLEECAEPICTAAQGE